MGGGYSDLNIYIKQKKKEYKGNGYKVSIIKKNFDICSSFVVFTHKIEYNPPDGRKYNVLLYDGYDTKKGEYLFGYYYPNDKEVIENIQVYFSVLSLEDPLVISFTTKGQQTYNCLPRNLKNAGWNRAYNISEYSINHLSKDILDDEFKKRSRNRKIRFTSNSENKDVTGYCQNIAEDNKIFRYIFIPKGDESVLGLNCLFEIDEQSYVPKKLDKPEKEKIQIDPYYLSTVNGHLFDGIMVYFADENGSKEKKSEKKCAILIEFYNSTKDKISFKRNDKAGALWSMEKVDCNEDKKLVERLRELDNKVKKDTSVTVILDEKRKYVGLKNCKNEPKNVYTKYTYEFDNASKPCLVFGRKTITINNFEKSTDVNTCEVYYLKVKDVEDDEPFVIVYYNTRERIPITKKACHFANKYKFEGWEQFKYEFKDIKPEVEQDQVKKLDKKLEEKLKKIDEFASCIPVLSLLRWYTYQILIGKDITDEDVKKEEENHRPPTKVPVKPPDGLPVPWIIGGSVGGGVFVISSAALYGVYWYNTTIKLLT